MLCELFALRIKISNVSIYQNRDAMSLKKFSCCGDGGGGSIQYSVFSIQWAVDGEGVKK
jgi:hypothetical protein